MFKTVLFEVVLVVKIKTNVIGPAWSVNNPLIAITKPSVFEQSACLRLVKTSKPPLKLENHV